MIVYFSYFIVKIEFSKMEVWCYKPYDLPKSMRYSLKHCTMYLKMLFPRLYKVWLKKESSSFISEAQTNQVLCLNICIL